MAYRFDGVDDRVDFAIAPFTGYVFGPYTLAAFYLRNAAANQILVDITDSGSTERLNLEIRSAGSLLRARCGGGR